MIDPIPTKLEQQGYIEHGRTDTTKVLTLYLTNVCETDKRTDAPLS